MTNIWRFCLARVFTLRKRGHEVLSLFTNTTACFDTFFDEFYSQCLKKFEYFWPEGLRGPCQQVVLSFIPTPSLNIDNNPKKGFVNL